MASKGQIHYVMMKVDYLEQQRQRLHQAVDDYINKSVSVGKRWLENQGSTGQSFQEITMTLANSAAFALEKSFELSEMPDVEEFGTVTSSTPRQSDSASASSSASASTSSTSTALSAQQHQDEVISRLEARIEILEKEKEKITGEMRSEIDMIKTDMNNMGNKQDEMTARMTDMAKKVDTADTVIPTVLTRVQKLEGRQQQQQYETPGFTARLPSESYYCLTQGRVMTVYTQVQTNQGNHYDSSTGVFTAPVDGVYLTVLNHRQGGKDPIRLYVMHDKVSSDSAGVTSVQVCETRTQKDDASSSSVTLVNIKMGDRLYVQVQEGGRILWPSGFSCFLIR